MGEVAPLSVTWWPARERCTPGPSPLATCHQLKAGKADPRVAGLKELTLPLAGCRAWKSRHYISPGQHRRADSGGKGAGDLVARGQVIW